jgi:hypothetical protein
MARMPDVIHRAELPIDDRPHGIDLYSDILHAAVRRHGAVDVWYRARPENVQHMRRSVQIVATGQPIPVYLDRHHGTAISLDGKLVWHVLENHCQHHHVIETPEFKDLPGHGSGICAGCHATLQGDGADGWIPA